MNEPEIIQEQMFEIDEDDARLLEQIIHPEVLADWPISLTAMMDVVAAVNRAEGLPAISATRLAGKVMHALAHFHGGRSFYLPNNTEGETAVRDREIFHLWMLGTLTPKQLADRYRLSYTWINQIISEQRGLWRMKYAPELPGLEQRK